jgi:DNA polymerase-1
MSISVVFFIAFLGLGQYTLGMDTPKKILILIDGNALIHRSYHGLPPLTTKSGEMVNAVYGFALTLLMVIEKFHPEYIAASFDLPGGTFRHQKFAKYKGTRPKAPDDLYAQISRVKELVRAFNIPIYELPQFEADDVIGTLARQATETDALLEVIIVTGDSDAFQLITDRVKVFTMRKGVKDTVLYDMDAVKTKYDGLLPSQLKDYKGLRGDASDNIPGVKGVGEKGAIALLSSYGSLEGVYASLDKIKGALRQKLESSKELAFLSKELGTIEVHAPVILDLNVAVTKEFDRDRITALFRELGFLSLIKRLPESQERGGAVLQSGSATEGGTAPQKPEKKITTTKEAVQFLSALPRDTSASLWVEVNQGTLFGETIASVAIVCGEMIASIVFSSTTRAIVQTFLESEHQRKQVYGYKELLKIFHAEGIALRGVVADVLLLGYLLDAGGKMTLDDMASAQLGENSTGFSGVQKARVVDRLARHFTKEMQKVSATQVNHHTLEGVYATIEMPLVPILAHMEEEGIRLNGSLLSMLSEELTTTLAGLEKDIYAFAGQDFNINSPKQLAVILFETLNIPAAGIKKLKTGYSTASSELAKLRDEYLIVQRIESYRELFKLKTTYLDTLPRLVDSHSRIHTLYHQEVTATGRLSSSHPNLQNIPVRNQWGEKIRSAFEAESGSVLIGADYSQIELRVAAHLADDMVMIEAFRNKEDIHCTTAALIYQIPREEVTDEQRRRAKVMNFGVMYGMGSFGLSRAAGVSVEEAGEFIRGYFEKFSGMAKYLEEMKVFARKHGFVETELGRRRAIPEVNSRNQRVAHGAERMAINMPIQGLEADIVKLSMIACDALIVNRFPKSARMLLQVHDELIFEVKEDVAEDFVQAIKICMENVYTLKVPLIVDVFSGRNWGEI